MAFTLLKPTGIDLSQTFNFTGTVTGDNGGNLKQIATASLGPNTYTTSATASNLISVSFTPTSSSTKVAVFCNINCQLYGNNSTSNPGGNFIIRTEIGGTGTDIAKNYFNSNGILNSNTSYIDNVGCLNGLFTPGATTQCDVYLRIKSNGSGRIGAMGDDDSGTTNATRLIVMEYST